MQLTEVDVDPSALLGDDLVDIDSAMEYLDQLVDLDAERMLELAVARKPLPVDHPTAALAYRVKDLAARQTVRAAPVDEFRRTAPSSSGPTLGL